MYSKLVNILFRNRKYTKYSSRYAKGARDNLLYQEVLPPKSINQTIAIKELQIIENIFSKYKIIFFLTHGSCLGAIREKKFISHDYDIDIGCYKKDIDNIILAIKELRDKYNFKVTKLSLDDESITIIKDTVEIDINLYRLNNQYWKSNRHKVFEIPYEFFENLKKIDFLEMKIYVPCNVEDYLAYQYGKNWRTPIQDFHCPYRQKIELPLTSIFKYFVGKRNADFMAKKVSSLVKKIRKS